MQPLIDNHPRVEVQEAEYRRLLGYPPGHALAGRARELAEFARTWYAERGRPWIFGRLIDPVDLADGQVGLESARFNSKRLHEMFSAGGAHAAVVVAVSAGPECEAAAARSWEEGKPDEYFFLEMFGSAVVENLIAGVGGRICGWAETSGMTVLPHYSPGYSGWDIADQVRLWQLIQPGKGGPGPGELEVLSTGMLRPKKSLLALFGLTRQVERARGLATLVPCENCSLPGCSYRRAPCRNFLPQAEDIHRMQAGVMGFLEPLLNRTGGLDRQAKYVTNEKALRKWAADRLRLEERADGTVEATFRYEGSTCSNIGRPLEFHYRVILGPATEDYRIVEAACGPGPGDTGHQSMCEYQLDAEGLMARIRSERPLLGRPLNDVLTWRRGYNPSACYCSADSRDHKWGLVFEVIHYALVQRGQAGNGQTAGFLPS